MEITEADLKKLTKEELTSECRKRNLPSGGSTDEIIKRLTVAIAMSANATEDKPEEPENKKQKVEEEESDSDDEIGPMKMFLSKQNKEEDESKQEESIPADPVPKQLTSNETYYLSDLPCSPMYEKSYTHPAHIQYSIVTPTTNYVFTGSVNGTVKIWKKFPTGIEFVKRYDAHKGRLTALESSFDGLYVASVGIDESVKIYDVNTFDLIRIIKLDYVPGPASWVYNNSMTTPLLAVVNSVTHDINVYDIIESTIIYTFKYHKESVVGIIYHTKCDYIISLDKNGVFNYWKPRDGSIPKKDLKYKFQVATDLYLFKKNQVVPLSLSMSKGCKWMGVFANDWKFYILDISTGKLQQSFDESEEVYKTLMEKEELGLEPFHFNKKLKLESILHNHVESGELYSPINCAFDETETFVLYGCLLGIKIMNIITGEQCCVMGEVENGERFLNVSLFQGIATVSSQMKMGLKKVRKDNTDLLKEEDKTGAKRFDGKKQNMPDPSLFCTSLDKRRFFIFTRNEPDTTEEPRDIINEKEVAEDDILQEEGEAPKKTLAQRVTLRTTMGDIELELWGDIAPKAVENFSTHCQNGYYDGVIFHRVIKNFMIQGGDPSGSGYGGESIWKQPFEDEISPSVKFDKPFLLAMANAGRCTNNSQFFISTAPAPWLDGKHTIFGKVLKGQSVVKDIERVRVQNDKNYRPFDDIKIVSTDVYMSSIVCNKHNTSNITTRGWRSRGFSIFDKYINKNLFNRGPSFNWLMSAEGFSGKTSIAHLADTGRGEDGVLK